MGSSVNQLAVMTVAAPAAVVMVCLVTLKASRSTGINHTESFKLLTCFRVQFDTHHGAQATLLISRDVVTSCVITVSYQTTIMFFSVLLCAVILYSCSHRGHFRYRSAHSVHHSAYRTLLLLRNTPLP
jgi:hypothetical protein